MHICTSKHFSEANLPFRSEEDQSTSWETGPNPFCPALASGTTVGTAASPDPCLLSGACAGGSTV